MPLKKNLYSLLTTSLSIFLLVLPGSGERKEKDDFIIEKKIQVVSSKEAIFTLTPSCHTFISPKKPPMLEDPMDPGATLQSLSPEPDYYVDQSGKKEGYPSSSLYSSIKKVVWAYPEPKRWQQESAAPTFRYRYNCHYRDDFRSFPENKLTDHLSIPMDIPPLLQLVEERQWIFLARKEGILQAMDPRSRKIYWRYELPLGIEIESMVSFIREKRTYILLMTTKSELLLLQGVDGSLLLKKEVKGKLTAPLQIMTRESETVVLLLTTEELSLVDPLSQKWLLQKKVNQRTPLSPLLVHRQGELGILLSYPSGYIEMLDQRGNLSWGVQLKGEILYDLSAVVYQGSLHIMSTTSEKMFYEIDGLTGTIRWAETLPGFPRSPLAVAETGLTYAVLVSQASEKSANSYFFSGSLINHSSTRLKIAIPGDSFIGLIGLRTKYYECYYTMTNDYQWMVINPSAPGLSRSYPVPLLNRFIVKPMQGFLSGRGMIPCEGSIFLHCQENGLLILGDPSPKGRNQSLQQGASNQSESYAMASSFFSNSRTRTDMDYLPEPVVSWKKRKEASPSVNHTEILTPCCYYLEKQNQWIVVMPDKEGKITFLTPSGDVWKQYQLTRDPIYTLPIVSQQADGTVILYVLSSHSLQKILLDQSLEKMKVIWKTEDLGSLGGSFNLIEEETQKKLLLVDDHSYLTVVEEEKATLQYRIKVDSFSFAISKYKGDHYLFCGSKAIHLKKGAVVFDKGSPGSLVTVVGMNGTLYLLQSDDLDMICFDFQTGEERWRIRKLWCKAYCFGFSSPSLYRFNDQALSYWADYKRIICIDVNTGMIQWVYHVSDDFFHSPPTVTVVGDRATVYVGSIRGKLYAMDGISGDGVPPYPLLLPGEEEPGQQLKGLSSPVLVNGMLLIMRVEFGLIALGKLKPPNQAYYPVLMTWQKKESLTKKYIFNRAQFFWDGYYRFSERVKWKITEGNPIIFLTFLKKMKKLM